MLPRIPEWWIFAIALRRPGAVFAPCPTMLTPRDIRCRVNKGKFRMIITDLQNTAKIEEIGKTDDSSSQIPAGEIEFVHKLPKTISGKIKRNE
jgi:acyl-coenzyme A synthetase/AMP-(fatty) acid ligase